MCEEWRATHRYAGMFTAEGLCGHPVLPPQVSVARCRETKSVLSAVMTRICNTQLDYNSTFHRMEGSAALHSVMCMFNA